MIKVYFLTYPFEDENTGDTDYCKAIVKAINCLKQATTSAIYLTSDILKLNNKELLLPIEGKNKGGEIFKNSLKAYFESDVRKEQADKIIEYIKGDKADQVTQKILNLQLRPPETGLIFTLEDLAVIQNEGIKICITCHEYKLNYDRRWLQDILHPYFKVAKKVFFFNNKDLSNANKHATRSVFIDYLIKEPEAVSNEVLLHSFSSTDQNFINFKKNDKYNFYSSKRIEIKSLDCEAIAGEIKYDAKKNVRLEQEGRKITASTFTLEWGLVKQLKIPELESGTFTVYGTMMNCKAPDLFDKENTADKRFLFDHEYYNLKTISCLTKVPPTSIPTSYINEPFVGRPPNIIIFGLIRDNKGLEEALDFITHAAKDLPSSRLIIVGKLSSNNLLADILNQKYGLIKKFDEDCIESIIQNPTNMDIIEKIKNIIIDEISISLKKTLPNFSTEMAENVYKEYLTKSSQKTKIVHSPDNVLQKFIDELAEKIPEKLPIDIFLDVKPETLAELYQKAKYCIKFDDKGWANNSSSLINALFYECILYTSWGMCTDKDVTIGEYRGSIVLPKGKYALKDSEHLSPTEGAGKKECYLKKGNGKNIKKSFIKAETIIEDIKARETQEKTPESTVITSNSDNIETLRIAKKLIEEEFNSEKIAKGMLDEFESLCCDNENFAVLGEA